MRGNPVPELFKMAQQAGFTQESFDKCLTDQKLLEQVTGSARSANNKFGVSSTPTFFINGKRLQGRRPMEAFDKALAPLLEAMSRRRLPLRRLRSCGVGRAALAAALLAACSGEFGCLLSIRPARGDGASALTTAPRQDRPAFNPFSDRRRDVVPARKVIEKPPRAEIMKAGALPEFSIGRADAPVAIIKYMSLTCPYCRRFQAETFPVLKREYIDTGKVRFIMREFPIGKASGTGDHRAALRADGQVPPALRQIPAAAVRLGRAGGAPRRHLQGRARRWGSAARSLTPAAESAMIGAPQVGQGARARARHHRHAELFHRGNAGEERARHQGDPRRSSIR